MRFLLTGVVAILQASLTLSAAAEQRSFIVANDADAYGVDRCLVSGAKCGAAVARAYCRAQSYVEAATYHKVRGQEVTGILPARKSTACSDTCDWVAIICVR